MLVNPFVAQRMAEEYMKDAMREAEQARLAQVIRDAKKMRRGIRAGRVWDGLVGFVAKQVNLRPPCRDLSRVR